MVFRDQDSSFRQLASESTDRGVTWATPVLTAMPDSRAKQSAGNLPDGTAFLVNAPSGSIARARDQTHCECGLSLHRNTPRFRMARA